VKTLRIEGGLDAVNDRFMTEGWSDGLPIVPPTPKRVRRQLEFTDRDPTEVIGVLPPFLGAATVHTIAVNAVMAGCRPEYFPVVLAGVAAIAEPAFNLTSLQATTNPVTTLLIVNGPIARELDINAAGNCFGPGWRANATIGRAVRLCALNIGGGSPHLMDKATHGQPGKFTMCAAENESLTPFEPFHVERGFAETSSTVTAFSVTGTQNVIEMAAGSAVGILRSIADALSYIGMQNMQLGGGPLVIICPEHADIISSGGFSKHDAKRFLYENARIPVRSIPHETLEKVIRRRRGIWNSSDAPDATIPVADHADLFELVVAGGPGPHNVVLPSFGAASTPSVALIGRKDGTPITSVQELRRR
jgi:hypothetical protein